MAKETTYEEIARDLKNRIYKPVYYFKERRSADHFVNITVKRLTAESLGTAYVQKIFHRSHIHVKRRLFRKITYKRLSLLGIRIDIESVHGDFTLCCGKTTG